MGNERGIVGEMTEENQRRLTARLRRLAGQTHALETLLVSGDAERFISQLEAVIAASKATLAAYIKEELLTKEKLTPSEQKLLERLISKFS